MTPLDVTPPRTLSTIQFNSDTLNTFLSSILITFVLAFFNSTLHNLITLSHHDFFHYESYLRAYIFNSSDDSLTILQWILGQNPFTDSLLVDSKWRRTSRTTKWSRLIIPLLARGIVIAASIASIAMAIPIEKQFSRCEGGEFEAVLTNPRERDTVWQTNSLCTDLGLGTTLGTTSSRLSFCAEPLAKYEKSQLALDTAEDRARNVNAVEMEYDREFAHVTTFYTSRGLQRGVQFYIEWTPTGSDKLRSLYPSFDRSMHAEIALRAISSQAGNAGCAPLNESLGGGGGVAHSVVMHVNCRFDVETAVKEAESLFRGGLVWHKTRADVARVRMLAVTSETAAVSERTTDCPYTVDMNVIAVNLVPLSVILVFAFATNMTLSALLRSHGNVDDASFHLVKEAFSLDTTLNPLEVNVEDNGGPAGDDATKLPFLHMVCDDETTAHVGYLGSARCTVVDKAGEEERVVSCCAVRT